MWVNALVIGNLITAKLKYTGNDGQTLYFYIAPPVAWSNLLSLQINANLVALRDSYRQE